MHRLPLYPTGISTPLDTTEALARDRNCARCAMHTQVPAGARCGSSIGPGGGVLVVLGRHDPSGEAQRGGKLTIEARVPKGTALAWTAAMRCPVKGEHDEAMTKAVEGAVEPCRGYLVSDVARLKPQRILAVGEAAVRAVLGMCPPLDSVRRGYAYTRSGVPVFLLRDPTAVAENRFDRATWANDVSWALNATPAPPPTEGAALLVRTKEDALEAVRVLYRAPWVAWDVETSGRPFDGGFRIVSAAVCAAGSSDAFVWDVEALRNPEIRAPLLELLTDPDVEKTAMNGKFDSIAARCAWGVEVLSAGRDIGLRRALLDPEALTRLEAQQWLVGMGGGKEEMERALEPARAKVRRMIEAQVSGQGSLFGSDLLPPGTNLEHARGRVDAYAYAYADRAILSRYNALDVVSTARLEALHERTMALPENECIQYVWDEVVRYASPAIEQMEAWGIAVNLRALEQLGAYLDAQLAKVTARLATAGLDSPGNPEKVAVFLYDVLHLKPSARFGRSTAEEAIEHLKGKHPAVNDLLEYRGAVKNKGTYCEGLRKQVTADGRIHPDTRISGARSGRMSMGGGMHGLPRPETPDGKMIRDLFVAEPDHLLVEFDLSQAELRVLAGLSNDPVMIDTFRRGIDIHQRTATSICRRVWKIEPAQVTKKHRTAAKTINLSLVYGKGDSTLAEEITDKTGELCTKEQAGEIREQVLGEYQVASRWMDGELEFAKRTGYARTFYRGRPARRRYFHGLGVQVTKENQGAYKGHERAAKNNPVQGSNADNVMEALIRSVAWVKASGVRARLVLTVHDSLLFEVHKDDAARLREAVVRIMEECIAGALAMVADEKVGRSYGSLAEPGKAAV